MNQKLIKTIVKEEVEKFIKRDPPGALYVFDFDDTLVTDTATVYVVKNKDGSKTPLTVLEFHNYLVKKGETLDFSEFEKITKPVIHRNILKELLRHLENSCILTARSKTDPIKDYLEGLGLYVPEIIAVGDRQTKADSIQINAERKRDWIDKAIQSRGLTYVEFWDDNEHNIDNVWSLQKKYPNVKIVCHLVRHQ